MLKTTVVHRTLEEAHCGRVINRTLLGASTMLINLFELLVIFVNYFNLRCAVVVVHLCRRCRCGRRLLQVGEGDSAEGGHVAHVSLIDNIVLGIAVD